MENSCCILLYHFQRDVQVRAVEPFRIPYTDVTYLIEGELHYRMNDTPITLHAGEVIVFPPRTKRERLSSETRATYVSLNIYPENELLSSLSGVIRNALDAETLYMLKRLHDCYGTASPHRETKCNALLSYLCSRLSEAVDGGENPYVTAVKQRILDDPSARHTLSELAAHVHLAPGYLCTLFKKNEGCTLFDYIGKKRVDYAKRLILSHEIALSEVAARAGFSDAFAFSHTFRKHEGISPSQFKRNFKKTI